MPRWISFTAILFLTMLPLSESIHGSETNPRIAEKLRRIESCTPQGNDYSAQSLRRYQQAVLDLYGNDSRAMPLLSKALYYEWILERYHNAMSKRTQIGVPHSAGCSRGTAHRKLFREP